MGQITKAFCEQMLVHASRKEHSPLTIWEEEQLASMALASLRWLSDDINRSTTTDSKRGARTVGPHGGLKEYMPSPTDADLADPLFEAIWQATKSWDVNVPEYYVGYCGLNGSHVMLILNAIRQALREVK